jgi:pimeloyl-ACP methyl ester carboxylesterase
MTHQLVPRCCEPTHGHSLLLFSVGLLLATMLPRNYHVGRRDPIHDDDDDDDDADLLAARRRRQAMARNSSALDGRDTLGTPPPVDPPLGLTGVLCETKRLTIRGSAKRLQYTVFRPRYLHRVPPLVCLAGGPFLPWTYLTVLVHLIPDRSLVFFDFVDRGQPSNGPSPPSTAQETTTTNDDSTKITTNPIPAMVQDLTDLLRHLRLTHYHLYAHSFGGLVAYEFLRTCARETTKTSTCLSLILSSTPAHLPRTLQHIAALKADCRSRSSSTADDDNDDDKAEGARLFAETHECRVCPLPLALQQSFAMAGFFSSPAGWQSVQDYVAHDDDNESLPSMPLLLLHGEFDFISKACLEPWVIPLGGGHTAAPTLVTLPGVAHYGMLEDERTYGTVLRDFLAAVPEPPLSIPSAPTSLRGPRRN